MLNELLEGVKGLIFNSPSTPHGPGHDPDGLIGQITGLFGQHQQRYGGGGTAGSPLPASRDPYGDPADQGGLGDVRPASQDPYGDPGAR